MVCVMPESHDAERQDAANAADLYFAGLRLLGFAFEPEAERHAIAMLAQHFAKMQQVGYAQGVAAMEVYAVHHRDCVLSFFEQGRPTLSGGYEQKVQGVWYEVEPTNKLPKCECGLDALRE